MKAKIIRTDGLVMELEGTPEEIQKLVPLQWANQWQFQPSVAPGIVVQPNAPFPPPVTYPVDPIISPNITFCDVGGSAAPVATSGYLQEVAASATVCAVPGFYAVGTNTPQNGVTGLGGKLPTSSGSAK